MHPALSVSILSRVTVCANWVPSASKPCSTLAASNRFMPAPAPPCAQWERQTRSAVQLASAPGTPVGSPRPPLGSTTRCHADSSFEGACSTIALVGRRYQIHKTALSTGPESLLVPTHSALTPPHPPPVVAPASSVIGYLRSGPPLAAPRSSLHLRRCLVRPSSRASPAANHRLRIPLLLTHKTSPYALPHIR